jgi:hypothetical protein
VALAGKRQKRLQLHRINTLDKDQGRTRDPGWTKERELEGVHDGFVMDSLSGENRTEASRTSCGHHPKPKSRNKPTDWIRNQEEDGTTTIRLVCPMDRATIDLQSLRTDGISPQTGRSKREEFLQGACGPAPLGGGFGKRTGLLEQESRRTRTRLLVGAEDSLQGGFGNGTTLVDIGSRSAVNDPTEIKPIVICRIRNLNFRAKWDTGASNTLAGQTVCNWCQENGVPCMEDPCIRVMLANRTYSEGPYYRALMPITAGGLEWRLSLERKSRRGHGC